MFLHFYYLVLGYHNLQNVVPLILGDMKKESQKESQTYLVALYSSSW